MQGRMQICVCRGGSKAAPAAEKISWGSGGRCKPPPPPPPPPWGRTLDFSYSGRLELLCYGVQSVCMRGIGVVVVGERQVLLLKFSTFHSIENTCKKIFLWEDLPGGGGGGA